MKSSANALIGQNIKRLREAAGLTQKQIFKAAKITEKSQSEIENGHRQARKSNLEALAKAIGCQVSEFYEGVSSPETDTKPGIILAALTMQKFSDASPAQQAVALAILGVKLSEVRDLVQGTGDKFEKAKPLLLKLQEAL